MVGVAPRMDIKKTRVKEIGLYAQNVLTDLGSVVKIIELTYMTI